MSVKPTAENQMSPSLRKSFLIRCWQQEGNWRFMLEDVGTRERKIFVDMVGMMGYVTAVLDMTSAEINAEKKP